MSYRIHTPSEALAVFTFEYAFEFFIAHGAMETNITFIQNHSAEKVSWKK